MAEFEVKVYKLIIEEHPNADALELAVVGDYRSIVRKGQFKTGDLGVYIVEGSIVPKWILQSMGLWNADADKGRLAGPNGDRVKSIKLRGILSTGLIYPVITDGMGNGQIVTGPDNGAFCNVVEGQDVVDELGIEKYSPPIPVHMAGEVFNACGKTLGYDIENIKKYPNVFEDGEPVVMTEKLHGTWCAVGYHPDVDTPIVTSKGLSGKGLSFKFNEANKNNLYLRAFQNLNSVDNTILDRAKGFWGATEPFYILGEIYGAGVQDLHYGTTTPQFRVFDIYWGEPGNGQYANANALKLLCEALSVEMVPVIYEGPYSKEKMLEVTDGKETVSGENSNIREGVVIKPAVERRDAELGRVALKSVSEKYLLRKGGTELN